MKVRFAPSPTGHLHVGNARTALFNWLAARGQDGTFVLRVEDTDMERSTRASEAAILDDLRWMGLAWDEGVEAAGSDGPYRQSERLDIYRTHTARLLDEGRAYYCFCTAETLEAERQAQLAAGRPPRYAGTCRAIDRGDAARRVAAGESAVVRLMVPANREVSFDDLVRGVVTFHTDVIGDPVLVRSDGIPAYNYAVVIDDALMHITHVIRGEDHISNTPRQVLLYEAFGWTPPRFAHLSLVLGPDHAPLSKRHGATSVAEFRAKGYLPEALVNYLALIGWSPGAARSRAAGAMAPAATGHAPGAPVPAAATEELLPAAELARLFRLEDVSHSAGVFDEDKLAWVNRHYLKALDPARLVDEALPFLRAAELVDAEVTEAARTWLAEALPSAAAAVDRLNQLPDRLRTIFDFDAARVWADAGLAGELLEARDVVRALADELRDGAPMLDREAFRAMAARVRERTGRKGKALFHPIRVVLTGMADGPELDLIVPAIERAARLPEGAGLSVVSSCERRARAVADRLPGETGSR